MKYNISAIRKTFLEFFHKKAHKIVPSAPLLVKNDPTLMFINSGMNQFKDYFLGNKIAKYKRVADVQKCLRVSGKHNDLEEVGVDTYHHTFFEMLGNWSFGDPDSEDGIGAGYFKKEAIEWAWELLCSFYNLPPEDLYVTVFAGDKEDNTKKDNESYNFWKEIIPKERILFFGKKDNFWEMGNQGPCGPCSEIHIDLRSKKEKNKIPATQLINKGHNQVIELWNLVFIEFNRTFNGKLNPLPSKHVDTGMGLERLAMILQGKKSTYDIDIFSNIIKEIERISSFKYKKSDSKSDIAIRVIADHIRAIAFCIADGQIPANTGAGYVIKRILRRALRYAYSFLNINDAFLYKLVPVLTKEMGDSYPELIKNKEFITQVIYQEELSFLKTLDKGIKRFNSFVKNLKSKTLPGDFIFELYDTYGFPVDLTNLMAKEQSLKSDLAGFNKSLIKQKERSKKAGEICSKDWVIVSKDDKEEFIGYDFLETEVFITKYREVNFKGKKQYHLVFNITPFYAEGGGQVGDTGYIENLNYFPSDTQNSGEKIDIINTIKENELIIHITNKLPREINSKFRAVVDAERRMKCARNHTATHILHYVLRKLLGNHIEQRGSLVHPEYLRFDFSHFAKIEDKKLLEIEKNVNKLIRQNIMLKEEREIPLNKAKKMGAIALFGEKYGDIVRVIKFGDSIELCGGTHVKSTGEIGFFKIVNESAIAAGIRRIEAVTAENAENFVNEKINKLNEINFILKAGAKEIQAVKKLIEENEKLKYKIEKYYKNKALELIKELKNKAIKKDDILYIIEQVNVDEASIIKDIAFSLRKEFDNLFLALGTVLNSKVLITIMLGDKVIEKGYNAKEIVKEINKIIGGGGGGQNFYATAGAKNSSGLDKALDILKKRYLS